MIMGLMNVGFIGSLSSTSGMTSPVLGAVYCIDDGFGNRTAYVQITNSNAFQVTVFTNGTNRGTINANTTSDKIFASGFSLNYVYSVDVYFTASGYPNSGVVNKSGTISFCTLL